jgi:catechol 2,3-dioxygenase-like lactoylglutathione lyase family enzyme
MTPTLPEKLVVLVQVVAEEEFLYSWFLELRDEPDESRKAKLDEMAVQMAEEDEELGVLLQSLKDETMFQAAYDTLQELIAVKRGEANSEALPENGGEKFSVHQLDHIEIYVPDREAAAAWYEDIFGLEVIYEEETPGGPWMISSDDGNTMLALFEGEAQGSREPTGIRKVAFRVDGRGFLEFLSRLDEHPVHDEQGKALTPNDIVDHAAMEAFSIHFSDPYGNRFEITSYDYELIARALKDG